MHHVSLSSNPSSDLIVMGVKCVGIFVQGIRYNEYPTNDSNLCSNAQLQRSSCSDSNGVLQAQSLLMTLSEQPCGRCPVA
jgi:hypothetical protein